VTVVREARLARMRQTVSGSRQDGPAAKNSRLERDDVHPAGHTGTLDVVSG